MEKTPAKVFRLTHNYRFLNQQVSHPENRLELSSRVVDVLSDPRNKEFASFDLRNEYRGEAVAFLQKFPCGQTGFYISSKTN